MGKTKKWTCGGVEDKFIARLIKDGKVTKHTKPNQIQKLYPSMFADFTPAVIRNHLNELKRSHGLFLVDQDEIMNSSDDEELPKKFDVVNDNDGENSGVTKLDNVHAQVAIAVANYPVICELFKDPENESEMLILAVAMSSGAQNVKIDLNDDGTTVIIKYNWPTIMFDAGELFKKQIAQKKLQLYHPKIIAFKNGLEKVRTKMDVTPESTINIKLPMKVQTSPSTWTKQGILQKDGTQVLLAEFRGYVKEYSKTTADMTVVFE